MSSPRLRRPGVLVLAYTVTLFGSALLLFTVEPMFAKLVLPLVGGTPSVWNAAVLFYQAILLAGYAFAHVTTRWLGLRRQALLQCAIVLIPLAVLPFHLPAGWSPPTAGNPLVWLLVLLTVAVGLPFFVISTTSPLLQRWFGGTGHAHADDPYFLYRASNLGSMIGLLAYPLVVEPTFTLATQADLWRWAYLIFAALVMVCAVLLWRASRQTPDTDTGIAIARNTESRRSDTAVGGSTEPQQTDPAEVPITSPQRSNLPVTWGQRLRWVALTAIPALWMLAVTSYLTTDIAPIPLLWVIPLAVYLLSFIIVFAPKPLLSHERLLKWWPAMAVMLTILISLPTARPIWLVLLLSLGTFLGGAMLCHGAVARDRPVVEHLTEFYLWIALGGVTGGALSVFVAPVLFSGYTEYPLAIIATCLLLPTTPGAGWRTRWNVAVPGALLVLVTVLALGMRALGNTSADVYAPVVVGIPALACYQFARRDRALGLGLAAILVGSALPWATPNTVLFATRDFFGTHRVILDNNGTIHTFMDGSTVHGAQFVDSRRDMPIGYYAQSGPLGDLFTALHGRDASWSVATVGLGTGTMACYARPAQNWTFFEINPTVLQIATDPSLFTYLHDCLPASPHVVIGDGRLSLAQVGDHSYNLIVLDAFGSDHIPVHLLTREALQLDLAKLTSDGVIAVHISNRYVDLTPVLASLSKDAGLVGYERYEQTVSDADKQLGILPSRWVVLARNNASLGGLPSASGWAPITAPPGFRVWTDDFSDVLSVLKWSS